MNHRKYQAIVAWLVFAAMSSLVQAGDGLGGHECRTITDATARLACYDAAFGKPEGAASGTAASVASARGPEEFGLTHAAIKARDPEKAKEILPESITGAVTEIGWRPTGEIVVTLDNGQIWVQLETDSKVRIKVGDTVRIKKGSLGSYLLVTPSRVATRARRLK